MESLARIAAGLVLLAFGRRLFWLFVAVVGFAIGLDAAGSWLGDQPPVVRIVLALLVGAAGALLAVLLQRVAIGVAAFLAVAEIARIAARQLGWMDTELGWVLVVVLGLAGAILAVLLFDVALIALSALLGAALVADALPVGPMVAAVSFVVLTLVGLALQSARASPAPENKGA